MLWHLCKTKSTKDKSGCAICRDVPVPFPWNFSSGCCIQEKQTGQREAENWNPEENSEFKPSTVTHDLQIMAMEMKGVTGNVTMGFKYKERY